MIARQHLPGFIDVPREPDVTFTTLDELLAVPWVKRWADDPQFTRWSLSKHRYRQGEPYLMAERAPDSFLVVALLSGEGADALELPEWRCPPL